LGSESSLYPYVTGSLASDLFIVAVTLISSGFFSASETALTGLSEAKARRLVEAGPKRNAALQLWLDRPNRVLTAILIGNNVVNTFAGVFSATLAERIFQSSSIAIATGVTTVALLIVGEITPKTFAKHNAERLAPLVMPIIVLTYYVTFPAVVVFTALSKSLVKLSGGEISRTGPFITEEDIAYMVQLGQQEGVLAEHEEKLITSVLEFGDTVVRECMVPRTDIVALPLNGSLDDVLKVVLEGGHSRMPVYEETIDKVKGFFYAKDLLAVLPHSAEGFSVATHLKEPFFVPELMKVSELLKEFQRRKVHVAVVVDEYGGTAGLVSLEDIIEELVGDIEDEYDEVSEDELKRIDDEHFEGPGKVSIHDVAEALNIEFPADGAYETLGGFLIANAGKMPSSGERVRYGGWVFTVKEADDRIVGKVEIDREMHRLDNVPSDESGPVESIAANG
jgi:putative hemolysin